MGLAPQSFKVPKELTAEQERLRIVALGLYWAEGSKCLRARTVDLANCDPEMVKLFLRYLREVLVVDERRLRVYLYCFADQDARKLCKFWSLVLKVPPSQFQKPYIRPLKGTRDRVMPHGVAHIRYSDMVLLRYILGEIEKLRVWAGGRAVKCTRL